MTSKIVKHILGNGDEQTYTRLYADEGKALTDGTNIYDCVDVASVDISNWTEIDEPEPDMDEEEFLEMIGGIL